MTTWDIHLREERRQQQRKTASLSSTLLDNIYHSIDEAREQPTQDHFSRRDNALKVHEEEISSLRRAIMIEKWMENYTKYNNSVGTTPKCEAAGRFTRTKSRAMKIYGELKKVKQPISPGRKISSFLNSIFSSRSLRKHDQAMEDWSCSLRKSKSAKDSATCTSRSCLSKASLPRTKSKRSVRFGPVVIVGNDIDGSPSSMPNISSHFIKENISSLRNYKETKSKKYEFNDLNNQEENDNDGDDDDDDKSCSSSDLFELENIGIVGKGMHSHREELPVYGTTSLKYNQAIPNGQMI